MSAERSAPLREEVFDTPVAAARAAAAHLAGRLRAAVRARGRGLVAVSGGHSPGVMFRALAEESVPWARLDLFQVDERDVPQGDPERNWTQLHGDLIEHVPLAAGQLHPMPLDAGGDLDAVAQRYARELEALAGRPPVLDVVHLGLGEDGHTASLAPGDPVLDADEPVAATRAYRGRRRVTLTLPTLDAARSVLWLVVGEEKSAALRRLRAGDPGIPAGRVARARALLVCDAAARDAAR